MAVTIQSSVFAGFARYGILSDTMTRMNLFSSWLPTLFLFTASISGIALSEEGPVSLSDSTCQQIEYEARVACLDSLHSLEAKRDSILRGPEKNSETSNSQGAESKRHTEKETSDNGDAERNTGYALNFMADWHLHGLDGSDFAKTFFVVAAVAVVGGTLIYLPVLTYKMIRNRERDPITQEMAFAYSYSGTNWEGGGSPMYRGTHMPGLRYSAVIAHPHVGLGLTVEGGYLAPSFEGSFDPTTQVELHGSYGLIGPMLRFGPQNPVTVSLEFLNGTSTAKAIGWVTKARMGVQAKLGRHALIGLQLGSLFYDMHFFDGTVWRSGSFNRDLAMTLGLETGYCF
jgi:hypothetical protein